MLPCQKVSLQKHIRLSLDLPQTSENRSAPIHRTLADTSGLESHDLSSFEYRRRNRRLPLPILPMVLPATLETCFGDLASFQKFSGTLRRFSGTVFLRHQNAC